MRSTPTGWLYRQVGDRQQLLCSLLVTHYSLLVTPSSTSQK
ncbi:hypothetical protein [Merismopedia glauca]|nr:hypothetical protein [Merismopedia glauca]